MNRKRKKSNRAGITQARPEFLTRWRNFYMYDRVWHCRFCDTSNAFFKSIVCEPDLIVWNYACNACNTKFDFKLDFKRLLKIHIEYGTAVDRNGITDWGERYRIFLTSLDYPELLQDAESEDYFHLLWEKLRQQSAGKMRFWNMAKRTWDKIL
jgi:hypothetical protein